MRAIYGLSLALVVTLFLGLYMYTVYTGSAPRENIIDLRGKERVSVVLKEDGFEPRDIRVSRGTTVIFSTTRQNKYWPASNAHPAHDVYPEFDPQKSLGPEESWSFTFEKVGVWGFHDHVRSYFTGTIHVDE